LFHYRAEYIRGRLVQGPGLILRVEIRRITGNGLSQFVADDIDGDGEALKDFTVTEHHLLIIPEGVVVFAAVRTLPMRGKL
jgi:hypothetical protein